MVIYGPRYDPDFGQRHVPHYSRGYAMDYRDGRANFAAKVGRRIWQQDEPPAWPRYGRVPYAVYLCKSSQ